MPGPIVSAIEAVDAYLAERAAHRHATAAVVVAAALQPALDALSDRITEVRRLIRRTQGEVMADLSDLTAEVNRVSDEAAEQAVVVDQVLAKLVELGVNDAELDALTAQLSAGSTSIDAGTTALAAAIAEPTPEPEPVEEPPVEPPVE